MRAKTGIEREYSRDIKGLVTLKDIEQMHSRERGGLFGVWLLDIGN